MRKRQRHVSVWLNDAELAHLRRQAEKAGMGTDPFLRALIMGTQVRPRPPNEYTALLRELSAIGNNLNQMARIANTEKSVSPEVIAQITKTQMAIWKKVKDL